MTAPVDTGLARVTIVAPKRRIDVALPETVRVAELLPDVLRHAGEGTADDGERHGGWVLRHTTGELLEPGRTLVAQQVHDGELLHLVPRRKEWPELEYDDVVEAIASGARRYGRSWGGRATRHAGLAIASALLLIGLALVLLTRPPWALPGAMALGFAAVLSVTGIVLSRAMADATAGAVIAGSGLPYAFIGGFLVLGPSSTQLTRFGAPHLLLGSALLLAFSVIGYLGVAAFARIFVGGTVAGLIGTLAGLISMTSLSTAGGASIAVTVGIGFMPIYPMLAARVGKLPFPTLPQRAEEILEDKPVPLRSAVFAAVGRSDELLTGLLLGVSIVSVVGFVALGAVRSIAGIILAAVASLALLLRARLFATARQRVPLLVAGLFGLVAIEVGFAAAASNNLVLILLLLTSVAAAAVALVSGLMYSKRQPSPYLGRVADIVDVLAIIALVPVTCAVVGLYSGIQGMFASIS